MLKKLSELFGGKKQKATAAVPNTPLEILVPDERQLQEAPRLAGKTMSFLVASDQDATIIEYFENEKRVSSSNNELKQFLLMVSGAKQIENLFSHCTAIMYPPKIDGSLGDLACMQQNNLYNFAVFERSSLPKLKWEIHRRARPIVQTEP